MMELFSANAVLGLIRKIHNLDEIISTGMDAVTGVQAIDFHAEMERLNRESDDGGAQTALSVKLDFSPINKNDKDWKTIEEVMRRLASDASVPVFSDDMSYEDELLFRRKFFEASKDLWITSKSRCFFPRSPLFNENLSDEEIEGIGVVPVHSGWINKAKSSAWLNMRDECIGDIGNFLSTRKIEAYFLGNKIFDFGESIQFDFVSVCFILGMRGCLVVSEKDAEPFNIGNGSCKALACSEVVSMNEVFRKIESNRARGLGCIGVGVSYVKDNLYCLDVRPANVRVGSVSWRLNPIIRKRDPLRFAVHQVLSEIKRLDGALPDQMAVYRKIISSEWPGIRYSNGVLEKCSSNGKEFDRVMPSDIGACIGQLVKVDSASRLES